MPNLELTTERGYCWEGFYISWSSPVGANLEYEWGKEAFANQKNKFLNLLSSVGYHDVDFDSFVTEFQGQGGWSVAFHSLPKKDYFSLLLEHYQKTSDDVTLKRIQNYLVESPTRKLHLEAYSVTGCPVIKDAYNALILKDICEAELQVEDLKAQLL